MTVLVIEDDDEKRKRIVELISERLGDAHLEQARSMQSGLRRILRDDVDVAVIDMTMPSFDITLDEDGGRPQAYAGRELLRHMSENDIRTFAIVVTQFEKFGEGSDALTIEQLDASLRGDHPY